MEAESRVMTVERTANSVWCRFIKSGIEKGGR